MSSKDWIFQQYIRELANGKLPISSSNSVNQNNVKKDHRDIYKKPNR